MLVPAAQRYTLNRLPPGRQTTRRAAPDATEAMLSDEQREEEDAATRLQAISRGHRDRQAVERTQTLKKNGSRPLLYYRRGSAAGLLVERSTNVENSPRRLRPLAKFTEASKRGGPGSIGGPGRVTETMCRMASIR